MKYSELRKHSEQLAAENRALKLMHVEQLREPKGGAKRLQVVHAINEQQQLVMGRKDYAAYVVEGATRELVRFLVAEGVVQVHETTIKKTQEQALVFEMKVIP